MTNPKDWQEYVYPGTDFDDRQNAELWRRDMEPSPRCGMALIFLVCAPVWGVAGYGVYLIARAWWS